MLGHDVVADYAAARRKLGIVPQELVFDPFFSVREALRIQSGYFGVHGNDAWIDELLANLGLADKADANMRQLSGGMKRRVLVAQALVHRPPVIVLDEPTAGVDVELRQTLWQFIARLNKRRPHGAADHALPRGGRGAVRPHRDAEAGPRGRARPHHARCSPAPPARCCASRLDRPLPPALAAKPASPAASSSSRRTTPREVESMLAVLRAAGCEPEDLEIGRADLEDVFLEIMQARRRRGWRHERRGDDRAARLDRDGLFAGTRTLLYKEVLRFWKVSFQTVAAPVLTAVLYLLIFGHVLEDHVKVFGGVGYTSFLIPGLVMMSVLQNAFANSSSSLIQSKITGNLVFLLVAPLSHWAWFAGLRRRLGRARRWRSARA